MKRTRSFLKVLGQSKKFERRYPTRDRKQVKRYNASPPTLRQTTAKEVSAEIVNVEIPIEDIVNVEKDIVEVVEKDIVETYEDDSGTYKPCFEDEFGIFYKYFPKTEIVTNDENPGDESAGDENIAPTIERNQPINWNEYIAAGATRNYMLNDPLCDWLKLYHVSEIPKNSSLGESESLVSESLVSDDKNMGEKIYSGNVNFTPPICLSNSERGVTTNQFTPFIMNQGQSFEENVMKLLYRRFPNIIKDIGGVARNLIHFQDTQNAMKDGIPIIYQGVLQDHDDKLYGIPDLIVRSDYINELTRDPTLSQNESKKGCKYHRRCHYRIIDIKFSALSLRADGIHLLNQGSVPAYKAQLFIYNKILAKLQNYNPNKSYILGRRWKYTTMGRNYKGNTCFDVLGTIDYSNVDREYVTKTQDAINWLRDVRSPEAKDWNISEAPLTRPELYPNMSNTRDYPWRPIKDKIANHIDEITQLWMCGPKQRKRAHSSGVLSWKNKECNSRVLGYRSAKIPRILDKMISVNQLPGSLFFNPEKVESDFADWRNHERIEIFVDFETISNIMTNHEELPHVDESKNMIFQIGVGAILHGKNTASQSPAQQSQSQALQSPNSQGTSPAQSPQSPALWKYKSFMVNKLTLFEEKRICTEFSNFVNDMAKINQSKKIKLYHWSNAEPGHWKKAVKRYPLIHFNFGNTGDWIDMLKLFKAEPIIIKGCLGFGLKTIAKALYKNKCIKTVWNEDSCVTNGPSAMVAVYNAQKKATIAGCKLTDMPEIKDIEEYNEVDVKVLWEIIEYLRQNH